MAFYESLDNDDPLIGMVDLELLELGVLLAHNMGQDLPVKLVPTIIYLKP